MGRLKQRQNRGRKRQRVFEVSRGDKPAVLRGYLYGSERIQLTRGGEKGRRWRGCPCKHVKKRKKKPETERQQAGRRRKGGKTDFLRRRKDPNLEKRLGKGRGGARTLMGGEEADLTGLNATQRQT